MTARDWSIIVLAIICLGMFLYLLWEAWPPKEPPVWGHGKVIGHVLDSRMDESGMFITMQITDERYKKLLSDDVVKHLSLSLPSEHVVDMDFNEVAVPVMDKESMKIEAYAPAFSFIQTDVSKSSIILDKSGPGGTISNLRLYEEGYGVVNPHLYEEELPKAADNFPDRILFLLENSS